MTTDRKEMNRRLIRLSELAETRFWKLDYEALSTPERVFRSVWELETEVNNGGFYQYLFNSTGSLAPQAAQALRSIGAHTMASITDDAITAAGSTLPWHDDNARQAFLSESDPDRFSDFDDRFYAYSDDLTTLLYRYVCLHRSDIVGVPADF
jgi:hypothetical protein